MAFLTQGGSSVTSANIVDESIVNADINPDAAIDMSKINVAAALTAGGELAAGLQCKTISVSAAEIDALTNVIYKELIAAPGAGKLIVVDNWEVFFDYNSVAFTGGSDLQLYYGATAVTCGTDYLPQAVVNAVADSYTFLPTNVRTTITGAVNQPIYLRLNAATGFATGNSTMKINIKYRIVTI